MALEAPSAANAFSRELKLVSWVNQETLTPLLFELRLRYGLKPAPDYAECFGNLPEYVLSRHCHSPFPSTVP